MIAEPLLYREIVVELAALEKRVNDGTDFHKG